MWQYYFYKHLTSCYMKGIALLEKKINKVYILLAKLRIYSFVLEMFLNYSEVLRIECVLWTHTHINILQKMSLTLLT